MNTYKITGASQTDNWIYVKCNEENSLTESELFVELVKAIAIKWNKNEWKGYVLPVGEMRYKVNNDPIDLVYQWDDLLGIAFEYKNKQNIDDIKSFIAEKYNIY